MRFGIFYEHQLPRPWEAGDERRLLDNALEQIELADRLGFDNVWEVEHHFLEEYSHSSAPEVFLVAPRVSHCDLRDPKWTSLVRPAEGCRAAVVVLDKRDDALCEVVD
jgi:hypothetical protein